MIDKATLEALVRDVVSETLQQKKTQPSSSSSEPDCDDHCTPPKRVERREDAAEVRRVIEASPARLAQGRVGTRYTTAAYVQLRAEHAIALDAVNSRIDDAFAGTHGLIALATRVKDHAQYLLHPDLGRRLDDASRERLLKEGTRGADVVVIVGDGLSATAAEQQVPKLLPALNAALQAQRFSLGKPVFVRHARIGVQDEIGVLLQARSTIILVGERPGLGTGDSLSIYTAFHPRLNQDNSEKNCISNVRDMGFPPKEAALECAKLMRRTFDAGGGGMNLVRPQPDMAKRAIL
ncbi:MAG: ethanolamine ammonia-lyase subunit EutC [Deltaproteobacteria bacterium]|nr:ethanolamine ammonia-lyase subunit EutC [Deltaproteobacteria bacterium]